MLNLLTTSASSANPEELAPYFVLIVFLFFTIIFCIVMFRKTRKAQKESKKRFQQLKAAGMLTQAFLPHIYGLPMPENTNCTIQTYPDHIEFHGGNMDINLSRSKIVNMAVLSDVEIQHQAVSSVGGAALGYAALGPLGAAIGGRVKNRTVRTATPYLVITYRNGEELKNIGFEAAVAFSEAHKMVDEFKKFNHNASMKIDL